MILYPLLSSMTDIMTPEQRHKCMAAIKEKDTKPEMLVRRYLHACGFRYSLHCKKLPGSPDLVFRSLRTVIFIHGCFWHGHENCKYYRLPKSNTEFWRDKVEQNRQRDSAVIQELESKGWRVFIIWECELKNKSTREATLRRISRELSYLRNQVAEYSSYILSAVSEPNTPYG